MCASLINGKLHQKCYGDVKHKSNEARLYRREVVIMETVINSV